MPPGWYIIYILLVISRKINPIIRTQRPIVCPLKTYCIKNKIEV